MAKWIPQIKDEIILRSIPSFLWHGPPGSKATITHIQNYLVNFIYHTDGYRGTIGIEDIQRDWELISKRTVKERKNWKHRR